jgi:hypothetical protein
MGMAPRAVLDPFPHAPAAMAMPPPAVGLIGGSCSPHRCGG